MKMKKPEYNSTTVQGELVERICSFFGRVYDDFEEERHLALRGCRPSDQKWEETMMGDPTINETAKEFGISPMKVRKLLITGGSYDTEMYREVKQLREQGLSVEQIAEKMDKKPGTVRLCFVNEFSYKKVLQKTLAQVVWSNQPEVWYPSECDDLLCYCELIGAHSWA